ncbi:hypothetical protein EVG20_g8401 [Dentipellis fragilis]|uniref:Uncharacterized protein n=1 Tax=Dentipellis fragilis TaxID=205917 RepID=A0A4Y9Y5M3_9AGAM|nr:hypothetical protein EVG20_g8401 [Dentipellis fragilis]
MRHRIRIPNFSIVHSQARTPSATTETVTVIASSDSTRAAARHEASQVSTHALQPTPIPTPCKLPLLLALIEPQRGFRRPAASLSPPLLVAPPRVKTAVCDFAAGACARSHEYRGCVHRYVNVVLVRVPGPRSRVSRDESLPERAAAPRARHYPTRRPELEPATEPEGPEQGQEHSCRCTTFDGEVRLALAFAGNTAQPRKAHGARRAARVLEAGHSLVRGTLALP